MSIAIKAVTVTAADGMVLVNRKPLCLPHVAAYKRDAAESWKVEAEPVGFVTDCARCAYEAS